MKPGAVDRLPKRIFVVSLAVVLLVGAFLLGMFAERQNLPPVPQLNAAYETLTMIYDNDGSNTPRYQHLQPARGTGEGVTVNDVPDDGAVVLMAGFFDEENQVRLVERDGTVVKKWSLDYFEHFPDEASRPCQLESPLRVDTHGALLTPQGDVVVNYEYCGTVKLDQCGELLWRIDGRTHHSLVPAESGGYWVLGRNQWLAREQPDRFPQILDPGPKQLVLEDTILRVSEGGEVLEEISIPELMRDAGLEAFLTADGISFQFSDADPWELVHANKVAELPSEIADAYPMFAAGDLAISLRGLNLVMVVDLKTREVKWHQTGPWLRQHDPEFRPDGRLSIYNNNLYFHTSYDENRVLLDTPYDTNIMTVDPATGETEVRFGQAPGQELLSVIRGDHELLEDDGMLITEFDGGRVLQVDADGQVVWEYVNAVDEDTVGEVTNASLYSPDDLPADWQTCA